MEVKVGGETGATGIRGWEQFIEEYQTADTCTIARATQRTGRQEGVPEDDPQDAV